MKPTELTQRLAGSGREKWSLHYQARSLAAQGKDIIELTIGEPDIPTPPELVEVAVSAMRSGRTNYADSRGETNLRQALAHRYSHASRRVIHPDQILCFPGTQTALFAVLMGISQTGDDVLVGDPMYATYEGVIRASGANIVAVPLDRRHGFRLQADDLANYITPQTRALLLTTPHNPTGAILTAEDISRLGFLARKHDCWIVCDEVYEELTFAGEQFTSPLWQDDLADRTIIVSSISKSHAAPGFRSGWCVGPLHLTQALLPLAESMLFGNQPFIADMTEHAIRHGSLVAPQMRERFAARANTLCERVGDQCKLQVHRPQAGMFAMIDVSATGMNGEDYALDLLQNKGVAVMPGSSFGATMQDWVRVSLTVDDRAFDEACDRIRRHADCL